MDTQGIQEEQCVQKGKEGLKQAAETDPKRKRELTSKNSSYKWNHFAKLHKLVSHIPTFTYCLINSYTVNKQYQVFVTILANSTIADIDNQLGQQLIEFCNNNKTQCYPSLTYMISAVAKSYEKHKLSLFSQPDKAQQWSEQYVFQIRNWQSLSYSLFLSSGQYDNQLTTLNWYQQQVHPKVIYDLQQKGNSISQVVENSVVFKLLAELEPKWLSKWNQFVNTKHDEQLHIISYRIQKIEFRQDITNAWRALVLKIPPAIIRSLRLHQLCFYLNTNIVLICHTQLAIQLQSSFQFRIVSTLSDTHSMVVRSQRILNLTQKFLSDEVLSSTNLDWLYYTSEKDRYLCYSQDQSIAWSKYGDRFQKWLQIGVQTQDNKILQEAQQNYPDFFRLSNYYQYQCQAQQQQQSVRKEDSDLSKKLADQFKQFITQSNIEYEKAPNVADQVVWDYFNCKSSFFMLPYAIDAQLLDILRSNQHIKLICFPSIIAPFKKETLFQSMNFNSVSNEVTQIINSYMNLVQAQSQDNLFVRMSVQSVQCSDLDDKFWKLAEQQKKGPIIVDSDGNVTKQQGNTKEAVGSHRTSMLQTFGLDLKMKPKNKVFDQSLSRYNDAVNELIDKKDQKLIGNVFHSDFQDLLTKRVQQSTSIYGQGITRTQASQMILNKKQNI